MIRITTLALVGLSLVTSPAMAQRFNPRFMRSPFFGPNVNFFNFLPRGNFVHSAVGTINIGNRSFVPTTTGATSLLRGQGLFMPTSGTFVPALSGNFLLTTREAFNTKTGKFVPSPTGNFLFTTRGDLVSSTSKSPVGTVLPFSALNPPTTVLPVAVTNPVLANPYATGLTNPYASGMANPYVPYYMPPYPMTNSATSQQINGYSPAAATNATRAQDQAAEGATGIPFENGHVKWPLAFRLLSPENKQKLTDPLEAQILALATHGAGGATTTAVKKDIARLSSWLTQHRTDMADATYNDGAAFIRTLDEALGKY